MRFTGVGAVVASRLTASVLQVAFFLALAATSPASYFALVSSILGVASFLLVVGDLGCTTLILRNVITEKSIGAPVLLTTVVFVTMSCLAAIIAVVAYPDSIVVIGAVIIWATGERLGEIRSAVWLARGSEARIAILLLFRRFAPLAVLGLGQTMGLSASTTAPTGLAIAGTVASAVCIRGVWRNARSARDAGVPTEMGRLWPYWLSSSSTQSRDLEPALILAICGPILGAQYALAYRLGKPFSLLASAFAQVTMSKKLRVGATGARQESWATVRAAGIGTLAVSISVPIWMPYLRELFGDSMVSGVSPLVICAGMISAASTHLSSILQGLSREYLQSAISFAAAASSFVMLYLLAKFDALLLAILALILLYTIKTLLLHVILRSAEQRRAR